MTDSSSRPAPRTHYERPTTVSIDRTLATVSLQDAFVVKPVEKHDRNRQSLFESDHPARKTSHFCVLSYLYCPSSLPDDRGGFSIFSRQNTDNACGSGHVHLRGYSSTYICCRISGCWGNCRSPCVLPCPDLRRRHTNTVCMSGMIGQNGRHRDSRRLDIM